MRGREHARGKGEERRRAENEIKYLFKRIRAPQYIITTLDIVICENTKHESVFALLFLFHSIFLEEIYFFKYLM